ncbi:MAG: phosphotriesterase-related protein [Chloroflexi bacterium]|nr:phosphotriesterase-related protein [Chloroflexota bacterium]MCL5075178.1 phosphotriesterase-related protein [Chloroflexota bacterium]
MGIVVKQRAQAKVKRIQTVLGGCLPEELGATAMHEHLHIDLGRRPSSAERRAQELEFAINGMQEFKAAGGKTVVSVTSIGMGRDAHFLHSVSKATGVHIVAGTGFYQGPFLPNYLKEMSIDEIAQIFTHDLADGIDGTSIKAGIIGEIGSSINQITALEEKVLRAAARAHLRTGAAISTHTGYGTMGLEQLDILENEGADLRRVIIGHSDINPDLDYHLAIVQRGANLEYDTIGKEKWSNLNGRIYNVPDDQRIRLITAMVKMGYANRLFFSSDIMMEKYEEEQKLNPETLGRFRFAYILRGFIPKLLAAGIDTFTVHTILHENPKRVLPF